MTQNINSCGFDYIRNSGRILTIREGADYSYKLCIKNGGTEEEANKIRDFHLSFGKDNNTLDHLPKRKIHSCNELADINKDIWKELTEKYDFDNLSYDDKRQLAEDFYTHGLLSADEKQQIIDDLNSSESIYSRLEPLKPLEYDKVKYPTLSDYMQENVIIALPEECAALREGLLVRNKYEHYIDYMRNQGKETF